jgi:hypothetical protein
LPTDTDLSNFSEYGRQAGGIRNASAARARLLSHGLEGLVRAIKSCTHCSKELVHTVVKSGTHCSMHSVPHADERGMRGVPYADENAVFSARRTGGVRVLERACVRERVGETL